MSDWTDRSEDVLARFEAMPKLPPLRVVNCTPPLNTIREYYEDKEQLMKDLATMVDELSHGLASSNKSIPGMPYDGPLCNPGGCRRSMMMYAIDPETGERLFPDPKS